MVAHPGHVGGSLLAIVLFVCILSFVGVQDMIQIISILLILLCAFFVVYYVKTEGDIMRRRKDKSEKAKVEEKVKRSQQEILDAARRQKLDKAAEIALEQVKAARCDELSGLRDEQRDYLIGTWRAQVRAYLEKDWTIERTVEKVSRGIPPS
jgi:Ca2+/Na+ antiporter